jgi:hypothetical protein
LPANKFIKAEDSVPIINSLTPREKGEVVIEAVVSEAGVGFVSALFSGGSGATASALGAWAAYPGLSSKKLAEKEATISTEIKAFQDPTSTIDPELFKERMLKLNAKEVVIKKALDYKVCSILNPETQQNVLFRQMENLVPKTPKAEKGKSLWASGNVFCVCDGPQDPDSKNK